MYGRAAAVSLSRFTGRNHFLSDVLVGSAIGYTTGRFVYLKRHDPALDGEPEKHSALRSKYFPAIAPRFGSDGTRKGREYGALLAWIRLMRALSEDGALILAGERLATSPGALSAVAARSSQGAYRRVRAPPVASSRLTRG